MAVNIIYQKSAGYTLDRFIQDEYDYYILTPNNWDDYGYATLFEVHIIKNKEVYSGMTRRILFDDQVEDKLVSSSRLNEYLEDNSADLTDFKNHYNFISLGADYKELKELFPDNYQEILYTLNDVIYLKENT